MSALVVPMPQFGNRCTVYEMSDAEVWNVKQFLFRAALLIFISQSKSHFIFTNTVTHFNKIISQYFRKQLHGCYKLFHGNKHANSLC